MAFNWQTFRKRTITAVVFVVVMLAGLLWNHWSFFLLFSIIHFGCWWEYLKLTNKIHSTVFHPYIKLGIMVMGYGLMIWFSPPAYQVSGYGLRENLSLSVTTAGFVFTLIGIFQKMPVKPLAFGAAVLGLLYISLSWGFMINLRGIELYYVTGKDNWWDKGWIIPCTIIGSIWINDTMAYIVGSLIGKTPLSKISPKKTWEGTLGGIFLSVGIVALITWRQEEYAHGLITRTDFIFIALISSVTGTFGDLLESKLKRMAGVKDSGSLMPGHGGFLDRFDSLLLATPFVWLYVQLVMS